MKLVKWPGYPSRFILTYYGTVLQHTYSKLELIFAQSNFFWATKA